MRTGNVVILSLLCLIIVFSPGLSIAANQPLEVRYTLQDDVIDEEQARWNAHINNQAYLNELQERRQEQILRYSRTSPTIVINRSGEPYCQTEACDSWGVRYQSGDTTIIYEEGYRPVKIYPVIILPKKHHQYRHHPPYLPGYHRK